MRRSGKSHRVLRGSISCEDWAVCARGAEGLEAAAKDLTQRGVRVFSRALDVVDREALVGFIDEAAAELGGLDILVCNPSAMTGVGDAAWQANFEVNLMSSVRSVEAATPHLAQGGIGSVVFIGTTMAFESAMGPTSYGAIKAALIAHAGNLSQALAAQGIRVNVVSPGPVYFAGGSWAMLEKAAPNLFASTLHACPQGRMGTPQEVANAVDLSPRSPLRR